MTVQSLKLHLPGNAPLYFQSFVARAVYKPEQLLTRGGANPLSSLES